MDVPKIGDAMKLLAVVGAMERKNNQRLGRLCQSLENVKRVMEEDFRNLRVVAEDVVRKLKKVIREEGEEKAEEERSFSVLDEKRVKIEEKRRLLKERKLAIQREKEERLKKEEELKVLKKVEEEKAERKKLEEEKARLQVIENEKMVAEEKKKKLEEEKKKIEETQSSKVEMEIAEERKVVEEKENQLEEESDNIERVEINMEMEEEEVEEPLKKDELKTVSEDETHDEKDEIEEEIAVEQDNETEEEQEELKDGSEDESHVEKDESVEEEGEIVVEQYKETEEEQEELKDGSEDESHVEKDESVEEEGEIVVEQYKETEEEQEELKGVSEDESHDENVVSVEEEGEIVVEQYKETEEEQEELKGVSEDESHDENVVSVEEEIVEEDKETKEEQEVSELKAVSEESLDEKDESVAEEEQSGEEKAETEDEGKEEEEEFVDYSFHVSVVGKRWLFEEKKPSALDLFRKAKRQWKRYYSILDCDKTLLTLYYDKDQKKKKKEIMVKDCRFYDAVKSKNKPLTIRLDERNEKKVKIHYVCAESLEHIDDLKCELEICGGHFLGMDRSNKRVFQGSTSQESEAEGRLANIDVENWLPEDVFEWLKHMNLQEIFGKVFKKKKIDGTFLVEIDNLKALGHTLGKNKVELSDKMQLLGAIRSIKERRYFSRRRLVVQSKFERFSMVKSRHKNTQELIDCLCNEAKLKHHYLSTSKALEHCLIVRKTAKGMEEVVVSANKVPKKDSGSVMIAESANLRSIKIKVVVTEVLQSSKQKKFREFISPLISSVFPNLSSDFGYFHTAIIVGPWYLEWTNSELVIPKRMVSGSALVSADVEAMRLKKEEINELTDNLAAVVVKWNTRFRYKNISQKNEIQKTHGNKLDMTKIFSGNCQDFVTDVLRSIGVNAKFDGAMGDFLKRMKKRGHCKLEFTPSKEFCAKFKMERESVSFENHVLLDKFVKSLSKKCLTLYQEDFMTAFQSEYSLLKSFDRAYWLRHIKYPLDPKYRPLKDKEFKQCACPFSDPRLTKSYC